MWTEAELSDEDLRSVYGGEALQARTNALLERLYQKQIEGIARMQRLSMTQDAAIHSLDMLLARLKKDP